MSENEKNTEATATGEAAADETITTLENPMPAPPKDGGITTLENPMPAPPALDLDGDGK
ncbi:hypothetical protein [Streptomyces sp. AC602_WCS936]|uniref:hypothetical protein n=1 Tax=Streptomyces sp. AC602_WCS936 TaxID=2823685 RepID=UPI001C280AA7|nr:hypothetical protein [Streptomyces sp. AC602_WCS936]